MKISGIFSFNFKMHMYSLITQILPSVEYFYIDELYDKF